MILPPRSLSVAVGTLLTIMAAGATGSTIKLGNYSMDTFIPALMMKGGGSVGNSSWKLVDVK